MSTDDAAEVSGRAAGLLVLVTGPSGAGKDSILIGARHALEGNGNYVFARRTITRAAADEDHDSVSPGQFDQMMANGKFALHWRAHGLSYGIPPTFAARLADGATVVCNVSRSIVAAARRQFANVLVIEITAPRELLRQRLLQRGRETAAEIDERLARQAATDNAQVPDVVIDNAGNLCTATEKFVAALKAAGRR